MKKLVLILAVVFALVVSVDAQKGRIQTVTNDTVMGNENIDLDYSELTGLYDILSLSATFSKISAAAGGTAYLQASPDGTNFVTLTSTSDVFTFFPNDTVTITDGGVMSVVVEKNPYNYYRWYIDGDVDDTVVIAPTYIYK